MALHPQFPTSPYAPLIPSQRWFPADETLRSTAYEKLLPPLVAKIREQVYAWREKGYVGASATSVNLLRWWFDTEHLLEDSDGSLSPFRYYFAQREAVETLIWLHDVRRARDKFDLLRFDASGAVSSGMFDEEWPRYVLKMATGAGKTKVLSLLIAWSFFHKLYEPDSTLARNFLVIAPNIIVLDRLRADFDGLRIFFNDPILPSNGHEGRNWRDDFQLTLHIQDDVRTVRETGNIFLTNIHRVFLGDAPDPSLDDEDLRDYFLDPFGPEAVGRTTDSKTDLGEIVREVEELAVFSDEAHHIHNPKMAWFKSIQDIHHRMLQKDRRLALQVDVTATPRHDNGAIFVQTVSDYPLVEAIHQNVVKHPVLPDAAMGLFPAVLDEAKQKGIDLTPKTLPPEVFDRRAVERGQVRFHDVAYIEVTPRFDKRDPLTLAVELTDFSVFYSQGLADAIAADLKEGKSEVVCEAGALIKISKDKQGIITRDVLTKHWTDWVDYWAVDFNYESRKEMIKVPKGTGIITVQGNLPGQEPDQRELELPAAEFEERWTGAYIFENEWQSFRTRQKRDLEMTTAPHTYGAPGRYTIAVKVIDIFGNDTITLVPVTVG